MNDLTPEQRLRALEGKRVVLVGIGHPLRGDDRAGIELSLRLREAGLESVVSAGPVPENYLGKIAARRPEVIVIADAAWMDKAPGEWSIEERSRLFRGTISTHDTSIGTLMDYLERETGAGVYLLGIQGKSRELDRGLSPEVEAAVDKLVEILSSIL